MLYFLLHMNRGERQRFSDCLCFPPDGQLLTVFHLGPRATGDDISPAYAEQLLDLGDFFYRTAHGEYGCSSGHCHIFKVVNVEGGMWDLAEQLADRLSRVSFCTSYRPTGEAMVLLHAC